MLRNDILNLSGKKIIKEDIITEGVKYFKLSKRLDKIIKQASKSKNPKKKEFIETLQVAKEDFQKAENEFNIGNKNKAKEMYKIAKVKNAGAVKQMMNSEMKSFILRAGLFGLFIGVFFILIKGLDAADNSGTVHSVLTNIEDKTRNIVSEISGMDKSKDPSFYDKHAKQIEDEFEHFKQASKKSAQDVMDTFAQKNNPPGYRPNDNREAYEEANRRGVSKAIDNLRDTK